MPYPCWTGCYEWISPIGHTEVFLPDGKPWINPTLTYDRDCATEGFVPVFWEWPHQDDNQMTWHFGSVVTGAVCVKGYVHNPATCASVRAKVDGIWVVLRAYDCFFGSPNRCWTFPEGVLTDFEIYVRHKGMLGAPQVLHVFDVAARIPITLGAILKHCLDQSGDPVVGITVNLRDNGSVVDTQITNGLGIATFSVCPGTYYFDVDEGTLPDGYVLDEESEAITVGEGETVDAYNYFTNTRPARTYFFLA